MNLPALLLLAPAPLVEPTTNGLRIAGNGTVPWTIIFVLTFLTLIPALLLSMTPMVRLLVVFHFLRQALGTQTAPSNQVLMGLGLMMTWFLMHPVLMQVDQQAVEPFRSGQITGTQAIERGTHPVELYMLHYAREKDLALFASATMEKRPAKPEDLPLRVVVPAYMLSELKARLPDWSRPLPPIFAGRPCGGVHHDSHWNAATASCGDLNSIEDSAFCDGGWVEPAGGLAVEKLLRSIARTNSMKGSPVWVRTR